MSKIKTTIMGLWNKLSDETKTKIISIFNTAGSVFLLTICTSLITVGHIEWNFVFLSGLISTATREAFKAVVNTFVSKRLGGRK